LELFFTGTLFSFIVVAGPEADGDAYVTENGVAGPAACVGGIYGTESPLIGQGVSHIGCE
jgi:hypothetical protein